MFKSMDEFKARAEFFPAGRIVPQRIIKGPRWFKHRITFGSDSWVFCTPHGYVIATDCSTGNGAAITINGGQHGMKHFKRKSARLQGSPYCQGDTKWMGNVSGESKQLEAINEWVGGGE